MKYKILEILSLKRVNYNTVKPLLTATSEERPYLAGTEWLDFWEPPKSGHFSTVPTLAILQRFDCAYLLNSSQDIDEYVVHLLTI